METKIPSNDPLVDITEDKRDLRVPLTQTELAEWAMKMAATRERLGAIIAEAKQVADGYKRDKEEMESRLGTLADEVRNGEARPIRCETYKDFRTGEVYTVRTDTGEEISRRSMSTDERQMRLDVLRRREENAADAADIAQPA